MKKYNFPTKTHTATRPSNNNATRPNHPLLLRSSSLLLPLKILLNNSVDDDVVSLAIEDSV